MKNKIFNPVKVYREEALSVWSRILTFVLMAIPLVNIIAYIAFVCGAGWNL